VPVCERVLVRLGVLVLVAELEPVTLGVCVVVSVPVPDGTYQAVLTGANAAPRNTVPLAAEAMIPVVPVAGMYE